MFSLLICLSLIICGCLSDLDCKYFGGELGPLLPIDVCTEYHSSGETKGSYNYQCDAVGFINLHWFPDSNSCDGDDYRSENALLPAVSNCGGDICQHVTIRQYSHEKQANTDSCYKNENDPFIEYAFVTECWDSAISQQNSWDLSCTSDSLKLSHYGESECIGQARNITRLTSGCEWIFFDENKKRNTDIFSKPFFTEPITVGNNHTYWEVTECGAVQFPWVYIIIAAAFLLLCCCGCFVTAFCCYASKKKCCNQEQNGAVLLVQNNTIQEGEPVTHTMA